MLLKSVGTNEVVQLNDTNRTTTVDFMENGSRIESPHMASLTIFNKVGDDVTIILGENSLLIITRGVKIGKRFVVNIEGDEAQIIVDNPNDIPKDASLRPRPSH